MHLVRQHLQAWRRFLLPLLLVLHVMAILPASAHPHQIPAETAMADMPCHQMNVLDDEPAAATMPCCQGHDSGLCQGDCLDCQMHCAQFSLSSYWPQLHLLPASALPEPLASIYLPPISEFLIPPITAA